MLVEGGVVAAIAGEPVGQEVRAGGDVSGSEAPSSAPLAAGSTTMRALPATKPCWRFTPVLALPVLWCRHLLDAATTRLLSGLFVLRPRLLGSPRPSRPPPESRAADGPNPCSARGAACAPWSRPSDTLPPVHAAEIWPRRRACRGPSGRRQEPLREIRAGPMKHGSRGHGLLPMAGAAALIHPRSSLQPPGLPSATAGTHKPVGPTKPGQVLDAPLLCPEPRRKLQKPSHPIPFRRPWAMLPKGEMTGKNSQPDFADWGHFLSSAL